MRLIDADLYKEDMTNVFPEYYEEVLDAQPTIDAVPVICCKDCVYYSDEKTGEHWHICRFYDAPKRSYGFCDDAEPKEKK